jgi:hypothetical protein
MLIKSSAAKFPAALGRELAVKSAGFQRNYSASESLPHTCLSLIQKYLLKNGASPPNWTLCFKCNRIRQPPSLNQISNLILPCLKP